MIQTQRTGNQLSLTWSQGDIPVGSTIFQSRSAEGDASKKTVTSSR